MNKIIKNFLLYLATLCFFVVGAFASDFEEQKIKAEQAGVNISLIGEENEAVKSDNGASILQDLLSVDVSFDGEYLSVPEYLNLLLNQLGYDAAKGDYLKEFPFDKAAEVGVLTSLPTGVSSVTYGMLLDYWNAFSNVSSPQNNNEGLVNYFAPSSSENLVNRYYEGFGDIESNENYKFDVFVNQEKGNYEVPVNSENKISFKNGSFSGGKIFSAISYAGEDITISVKCNADIFDGYSVVSTENAFDTIFDEQTLKIVISKPQILKVTFDSSEAKTLIIFVGDADTYSPNNVAETLKNGIAFEESTAKSGKLFAISPIKLCCGNILSYVSYIVKNENPYILSNTVDGDYSRNEVLIYEGCEYIPISAFENSTYDAQKGILYIPTKAEADDIEFTRLLSLNDNSDVKVSDGTFLLSAKSDADAFGVVAPITNHNIYNAKTLKFSADLQMAGNDKGVELNILIVGYNGKGEADVIASVTTRAYGKEYATSSYFEPAEIQEAYEGIYFVVTCDVTNATINMAEPILKVFNTSTDFGDNEYNPF